MTSRRWNNVTKIIVASALAISAILLLVTFRQLIAPTIVAFLLTFVLSYPLNWLQQRTGWGRTTSVLAVYVLVVVGLILLVLIIFPRMDTIVIALRRTIEDLTSELQSRFSDPLIAWGPVQISANEALQQLNSVLQGVLTSFTQNPMGIARSVTTSIVSAVYVFVLNFWLLKDWHKLQRVGYDLVPAEYQEEMRRLMTELGGIWQAFLRGQLTLGIVIGLMTWVSLLVLGMPNAGGLALLAGLLEFLPSIGPAISGFVGTVLALFQGSGWMPVGNLVFAVVVGVVYSIIGQLESVYFIPRFVGGRVKLHPAVTFVGIMGGALTFGVLGILLAAPVIASARTLLVYIARKLADREPFPEERSVQSVLHIPGVIAGRKIEAVLFDLDGTLSQVDTSAIEWSVERLRWLDRVLPPDVRRLLTRRFLTQLEAPINFFSNQLWRWHWRETAERVAPTIDRMRGYPPAAELQLLPESREMLLRLARSYRLGMITQRERAEVDLFLERNQISATLFAVIVTREDVKNILPHVEPLARAATKLGLHANQILVVSDTDVGLRAARAAEMATAGVTIGLALPENVRDADIVLPRMGELAAYL